MSKINKPNFFNKFFKKKSDNQHDDHFDAELNKADLEDKVDQHEERYHSDDDSSIDLSDGIQLEDPEEVFDATEFTTSYINHDSNSLPAYPDAENVKVEVDTVPSIPSEDFGNIEEQAEIEVEETKLEQATRIEGQTEGISQSINLDEIKNYELTSDDELNEETFADYKLITKKESKGLRAFLDKSKSELSKFVKGDYKKLLNNVKRPKSLKTGNLLQQLNFENIINSLYGPSSRKNIHKVFIATAIISGTYTTGKIIALALKGTPNTKTGAVAITKIQERSGNLMNDINSIRSNNLFNALLSDEEDVASNITQIVEVNEKVLCKKSSKVSSLPLKLQNTLVLQDSVKSIASVQVRSNKIPTNVRLGDKLDNIAKIGHIGRLKLIFKNLKTGECEFIENKIKKSKIDQNKFKILDPVAGQKALAANKNKGIKNEGNSYNIKKSVRDDMLANISEILTQARAVQIKNPDGTYSFKMTEIVAGSLYTKLGIENGDIITEVDGKKIQNLNEIMSKLGTIKDKDHFSIGFKKNGAIETKEYNFD
jgi:hypothetical protein